jgi:hypothetical protein
VLAWLIGELVIALVFSFTAIMSPPIAVRWLFCIVVSLRIIEIIHRVVVTRVRLILRTFVLAGINYVELALCFGIIYALNYQGLHGPVNRLPASILASSPN